MLTQKGTKTLTTERLTLRRFTREDAQAMYENWAKDERVTRYLTWEPHRFPEETRQLLEGWCEAYDDLCIYNWAMELEGEIIGNISVVHLDEQSEYADLGYCMGYAYWNRGLMTEAVSAVIDYLFESVGVNRVGIVHATKNPASGRVAQKCGCTYEGTRRAHYKRHGEFLDIAEYGILRSDWEAKKAFAERQTVL